MAQRWETQCPECGAVFNIHKNRSFKFSSRFGFLRFFEGLRQFERHFDVTCPECGARFNSPDSKLFGVFKSAWSVLGICIVVNLLFFLYFFVFEIK